MKTSDIKMNIKVCIGLPYLKTLPLYCFNNSGYSRKSKFNSKINEIKKLSNYCFGGNNILNVSIYPDYYHNLSVGFYEYEVYGKTKYKADISIGDLFGYNLISIEVPLKHKLSKIDDISYNILEKALRNYQDTYSSIENIMALNNHSKERSTWIKGILNHLKTRFKYT